MTDKTVDAFDQQLWDLVQDARRIDADYTCGVLLSTVQDPETPGRMRYHVIRTLQSFVTNHKWELFASKRGEAIAKSNKMLLHKHDHKPFIRYALDQLGINRVSDLTPETVDDYLDAITKYSKLIEEFTSPEK